MRTIVFSFLVAAQLWGQQGQVTEQNAKTRLPLDPHALVRASRSGDKLIAFENPQSLSIFSTVTGALELRKTLDIGQPVRDLDVDASGAIYFLTKANAVIKWKPQSAGFEFRTDLVANSATAIAVDESGQRIFVATADAIWMLDGNGEIATRGSQKISNVEILRFIEVSNQLYAQGPNYVASLPATLDSVNRHNAKASLPGASNTLPQVYPTGFKMEPAAQTVNPGGMARFSIRTIPRDQQHGPLALTVDAPLPYVLDRNQLTLNDASQLTISIPANQAPGVYRVVARLDNGTSGIANAVFMVPFPGSTLIPVQGTATQNVTAQGLPDPNYRLISSPDPQCPTARIVFRSDSPVGSPFWSIDDGQTSWISGRADAGNGCYAGLYRYRTDFDLRDVDPRTANIAVAVYADNAATLEINGTAIPGEPQPDSEAEAFRTPRIYGIPREALRVGTNSLDFIVRNDPFLSQLRNPTALRVEVLNATAVPIQAPEPPPVGDFWLSLTPPFKFVNGTTVYYTINVNRIGGFSGNPNFVINITPPTGYSATINGNLLTVTRDPNVTNAPTSWRFAVLGIFSQTTRSVDGAFIQNPFLPIDLPVASTGVVTPGVPSADNSIDTHYTLSASADANFPGPSAYVADVFRSPFGPWTVNDQNSKWIAPRPDPNNLNSPGVYRYRTTFDLGLGDARSAAIALRWAADNDSKVYLNGLEVTALFNLDSFRRLNEALITQGFQQGTNILEFAVNNANLGGSSQTGLRVELLGAQAARNPVRVVQVLRNRTSTGPVLLNTGAFTYTAPVGVTVTSNATNLLLSASDAAPLGIFPVTVAYNAGGFTSLMLVIGARDAVSYVVNSTGQADEGTIDPNYKIVQSPDMQFPTQEALVIFSNTSPVSLGFWTPNTINSRWIAPRRDTLRNNAPGTYRYRTTFDLSGRIVSGAMIALEWACDNRGRIELNGVQVDEINTAEGFRTMRPVSITGGFRVGVNTLDFVVVNDGSPYDISPTGLHANILGAFAVSVGTNPGPDFAVTPDPGVRVINAGQSTTFDVRLNPNFIFVDPVVFSITNPPAGFTFSFSPLSSKVSTVLTVTASGQIRSGTYPVTIRARYGDIIRDIAVRVDIAVGAPNLRVWSTGQATAGSVDPNYTLVDGLGSPLAAYVVDLAESPPHWSYGNWIAPSRNIQVTAAGTYRYRTSFDLTGFDPNSVEIRGIFDADDTATVLLNGSVVTTLNKINLYDAGQLLINTGFRAGVNQLEFVVTNATNSPTGLMVTIQSVTARPQ